MPKLVRLREYNPAIGQKLQRVCYDGVVYRHHKDGRWSGPVPDSVADALSKIQQDDRNPNSPPAFDVADNEPRTIDKYSDDSGGDLTLSDLRSSSATKVTPTAGFENESSTTKTKRRQRGRRARTV